jgi:V8-like Glu-specific endopeptidase
MMKFIMAMAATVMLTFPALADPVTEIAERLPNSVGKLYQGSRSICTAWKYGDKQWATAGHCVKGLRNTKYKVDHPSGDYGYMFVRSITQPVEQSEDKNHYEDWGTLRLADTVDSAVALEIDCEYTPKVGEQIAYFGFPGIGPDMQPMFSVERINAVHTRPGEKNLAWHYAVDFTAGPGASGSPVVALSTGKVIGLLTKGVGMSMGLLTVGIESVKGMDMCENPEAVEPITFNIDVIINDYISPF